MAGERQEIPIECPPQYSQIIESCWAQKPSSRPSWSNILKILKEIQDFDEQKYQEMELKNVEYWKRLMDMIREKELQKQRLEEEKKRKREEDLQKQAEEEMLKRETLEKTEKNEKKDEKKDKKKNPFALFKAKKSESHLKPDTPAQPQAAVSTPPTSPQVSSKTPSSDWKSTETPFTKAAHTDVKSKTLIGNRSSFSEPPTTKKTSEEYQSSQTLPKLPSLPDSPDNDKHSTSSDGEEDRPEDKKRRSRRTKQQLSKTSEDLKEDKGADLPKTPEEKTSIDRSYSTQERTLSAKQKDKTQKKKKRQTTLDTSKTCPNCFSLLDPTSPLCKNCQAKNLI